MNGPLYHDLQAAPGVRSGSTPWRVADEGTIWTADGEVVCVLGEPFTDLTEEDVVHGALILLAPELLELAKATLALLQTADFISASNAARNVLVMKLRRVIPLAEGRP